MFSAHQLAQARLQVLEQLIQREVLFQRAEQEKLLPSEDEITNVINKQKQDSGMTDESSNATRAAERNGGSSPRRCEKEPRDDEATGEVRRQNQHQRS